MALVRVLQIVTHMERGGLETMLMNYYRHMDRQKVQFDFLKDFCEVVYLPRTPEISTTQIKKELKRDQNG